MKVVFIPIEIKYRELNSQLYLADKLVNLGFCVYLGDKSGIYQIIKNRDEKSGVLLYKGTKRPAEFENLRKNLNQICVLDQELGFAISDKQQGLKSRIIPGADVLIDRYYLLNDEYKDALEKVNDILYQKSLVTGWPKVDLWNLEDHKYLEADVEKIKKKFGRFLLFSSDFGVNSEAKLHGRIEQTRNCDVPERLVDLENQISGWRRCLDEFHSMVELLVKVDGDSSLPPIVVRPHPAEDKTAWEVALKGLKKTYVVYEHDVSGWILASAAVLHRGCTSGVEAYVRNVPVGHVVLENFQPKQSLSYELSKPLSNWPELADFLRNPALDDGVIKKEVESKNLFCKNAADLIAKDISLLSSGDADESMSVSTASRRSMLDKGWKYVKSAKRFFGPKRLSDRERQFGISPKDEKLPDGIRVVDAERFFTDLRRAELNISQVLPDVIKIEASTT